MATNLHPRALEQYCWNIVQNTNNTYGLGSSFYMTSQSILHLSTRPIQYYKAQAKRITTTYVRHDDKIYTGRVACYL